MTISSLYELQTIIRKEIFTCFIAMEIRNTELMARKGILSPQELQKNELKIRLHVYLTGEKSTKTQ